MQKEVTIWSEGTRMSGDLFIPDDLREGERRPAILLCHGWAGPKSHLSRSYAPVFCEAGFVCLTFDYRGWYESDSRLVTVEKQPEPDADGYITVRARPVREVVDPLDQNRDIHNAMDFLLAEPSVDPARFGLWGSSYGGGHVINVTGNDPRVRAVVAQVPGMGTALDDRGFGVLTEEGQRVGSAMARGEIEMITRSPDMPESLKGSGDPRTMWLYHTRSAAANIQVPALIIDQEEEEYGGRENSGLAAKNALPAGTISEYHVLPGTHYDVYGKNFRHSAELAVNWFNKYLK